jgi:hypothetical protein
MARANIHALDVPLPAFFQQRSANVLPDVVTHEIDWNPIPATEIHKRNPNLGARS